MALSVQTSALNGAQQHETERAEKVNFRANKNNNLERSPEEDTFDGSGKKKKTGKIVGWLLATAAVIAGFVLFKKSKAVGNAGKKLGEEASAAVETAERRLLGSVKASAKDVTESAGKKLQNEVSEVADAVEQKVSKEISGVAGSGTQRFLEMAKVNAEEVARNASQKIDKEVLMVAEQKSGIAYKKIVNADGVLEKRPVSIRIEATRNNTEMVTYKFFDGDIPVGLVQLEEHFNIKEDPRSRFGILFKDYPEYGVKGDRVIVHMLRNFNEQTYAGIGNLADRVAVQHCLLHGIEPNVLSEAAYQSHLAHFLRGKRFLPLRGEDYNEIFENLAKNRVKGVHVDTSEYGSLSTYMPREMVERLKAEVLSNPIFEYKI